MKDRIFVYGLLRKDTHHPMSQLLREQADYLGPATFKGNLYMVEHYPGVIPSTDEHALVHGDLFEFEEEELLASLDEFEEVGSDFPRPNEYVRKKCQVAQPEGQIGYAWIYLYNHPTEKLKLIQSGDFLKVKVDSSSS